MNIKQYKVMYMAIVFSFMGILLVASVKSALAIKGVTATLGDVEKLKKDLLEGKLEIGQARLKHIQATYGDAPVITSSDRKVTYDYGDVKIDFDKDKLWRGWEKDGFKPTIYNDNMDDLRFDLANDELVGENITSSYIAKKYGVPTVSEESDVDGGKSYYYYGDIKMIFENMVVMRSWKGRVGELKQAGNDE